MSSGHQVDRKSTDRAVGRAVGAAVLAGMLVVLSRIMPVSLEGVMLFWPLTGLLIVLVALCGRTIVLAGVAGMVSGMLLLAVFPVPTWSIAGRALAAQPSWVGLVALLTLVLACWLGWRLGRNVEQVGGDASRRRIPDRRLLRFCFLTVPLTTLILALVLPLILTLWGGFTGTGVVKIAMLWWLRECLGIWLVVPLVVYVIEQWREGVSRTGRVLVVVGLVVVMGLGGGLILLIHEREHDYGELRRSASMHGEMLSRVLEEKLRANRAIFAGFHNMLRDDPDPDGKQFARIAAPVVGNWPALTALGWMIPVRGVERGDYERAQREQGRGDFHIHETVDGRSVPAGARPLHVVVHQVAPVETFGQVLGFDMMWDPRRRVAVDQAMRSSGMFITQPIRIHDNPHEPWTVLMIQAVHRDEASSIEPDRLPAGFAVMILRVVDIFGRIIDTIDLARMDVQLQDITGDVEPVVLLALSDGRPMPVDTDAPLDARQAGRTDGYQRELGFGARRWRLVVEPRYDALFARIAGSTFRLHGSTGLFLLSLALTGLICQYLLMVQRRSATIQREVQLRTEQISRINQRLRDEVERRSVAQRELRENEALFRDISEAAPVGMFLLDARGRLVHANPRFAQLLSLDPADVSGEGWLEGVDPSSREAIRALWRNPSSRESPLVRMEWPCLPSGSAQRWISMQALHRIEGGWVGTLMDVTDIREAMNSTRIAEQRYRLLLDSIPDYLLQVDGFCRVTYVNQAMAALVGVSPDCLRGQRLDGLDFDPAVIRLIMTRLHEVQRDGHALDFEWQGLGGSVDVPRYFESRLIPECDSLGRVDRILMVARDVTRRKEYEGLIIEARATLENRVRQRTEELALANASLKEANKDLTREVFERGQAEDALRNSERFNQQIVQATEALIYVYDPVRRVLTFHNRRAAEIFPESWVGPEPLTIEAVIDAIHPDDRERVRHHLAQVMRLEVDQHAEMECRFGGADEDRRWFHVLHRVFERGEDGAPIRILGMAVEITAIKQAELSVRRSERLASIGTLAAGIAHEINNPLGMMLITAHDALMCLRQKRNVEEVPGLIEEIIESTRRCAGIVKRVLAFSRHEPSILEPVSLAEPIRRGVSLVDRFAGDRGCELTLDLPPEGPTVNAVPSEVEQLIVNLVHNGVQAGARRVAVRARSEPDGVARVSVMDDGRGMTAEEAERAFDPFYTNRFDEGGTGLGLSICHGIINDHGGSIRIDRTGPDGTEISFTLPLADRQVTALADSSQGQGQTKIEAGISARSGD
ncbi:MAG: PAS domain-containing protein [Phycisphaeraceae bacterium]|nr:PAS domain-containing protein [Phycisphaeraceae bacterium]